MERTVKPRPAVLRALGNQDPPAELLIDGVVFKRDEVFKHDSWAATALYRGKEFDAVCKMNRSQSIYGFPMKWLGRFLANREAFAYSTLTGIEGIAPGCNKIARNGRILPNVVAHQFVPGHPLGNNEEVNEDFFPGLLRILKAVHKKGIAYVDLHKRENILVGDDTKPYLIDFQISYYSAPDRLFRVPFSRTLLRLLQNSDLYHLTKHVKRHRPEQVEELGLTKYATQPWWIRAHRKVAVPFRQTRRRLLTLIGVRGKSGRSATEVFAEHAFRCENEQGENTQKAA